MLHVTCCLWDWNKQSESFSRCYDETWAEKLYRNFRRHLTLPFRFVVFTDRPRVFEEAEIDQEPLPPGKPDYGSLIVPYRLNQPMICCGLDTVVVGNIDHLGRHCLNAGRIALPRDPYKPEQSINGVQLVPRGQSQVWANWHGENDMVWLRTFEVDFIDDLFPGEVLSLKAHDVRRRGLQGAKIVYMHGEPKQPSLMHLEWMRENWQ